MNPRPYDITIPFQGKIQHFVLTFEREELLRQEILSISYKDHKPLRRKTYILPDSIVVLQSSDLANKKKR